MLYHHKRYPDFMLSMSSSTWYEQQEIKIVLTKELRAN